MTFYSGLAATATDLLTRFGQAASIRRTTSTGGGPSNASGATRTETDYACLLAVFPVSQADIASGLAKAGDYRVIVADLEIVPTTTDKIVCSYGTLVIVDAGRFAPAGTTTHYKMIARKP